MQPCGGVQVWCCLKSQTRGMVSEASSESFNRLAKRNCQNLKFPPVTLRSLHNGTTDNVGSCHVQRPDHTRDSPECASTPAHGACQISNVHE
eukprot:5226895-Amphidinium_carterae.2